MHAQNKLASYLLRQVYIISSLPDDGNDQKFIIHHLTM